MNIVDNRNAKKVQLKNLHIGDTFLFEGNVCIKTGEYNDLHQLYDFLENTICLISKDAEVEKINAEIVIKD